MNLRLKALLAIVVVALTIPVIVFRGTLRPPTVAQVEGLDHVLSMQAVSDGKALWSDSLRDPTLWRMSKNSNASVTANGSLDFTVSFSGIAKPTSVSISRSLSLSLNESPVVRMLLNVSRGVSYGIRFFGVNPDNTTFSAWQEGSKLQHRPGLGVREFVSANLVVETFLATQKLPANGSRITQVFLYIEAVPETRGKFSMNISALSARSLNITTLDSETANGSFSGLILRLGPIPNDQPLFQVFIGFDIKGTPNLRYTPYLTEGMTVKAQGYTYVPKNITTYELAVLTPQRTPTSSPFPTNPESDSIVISAGIGQITLFQLNSLSIRFTSQPRTLEAPAQLEISASLALYYFFFLFITPIGMVILLDKVFKPED